MREARKALGFAERYFEVAGSTFKALSAKSLSTAEMMGFVSSFLPMPMLGMADQASREGVEQERERITNARTAIFRLYEEGRGTDIPGVRGTAWGAYNAATEWIDRVRTSKKDGEMRANGAEAAVLGIGQDFRNLAMKSALALL